MITLWVAKTGWEENEVCVCVCVNSVVPLKSYHTDS